MDPETVKALKLQQEAHNRDMQDLDELFNTRLAKIQEVTDQLVLAAIEPTGGEKNV